MDNKSLKERIAERLKQFSVGDNIKAFIDGCEIDGVIVEINGASAIVGSGRLAKVNTKFGVLTADLALAEKCKSN